MFFLFSLSLSLSLFFDYMRLTAIGAGMSTTLSSNTWGGSYFITIFFSFLFMFRFLNWRDSTIVPWVPTEYGFQFYSLFFHIFFLFNFSFQHDLGTCPVLIRIIHHQHDPYKPHIFSYDTISPSKSPCPLVFGPRVIFNLTLWFCWGRT